MKETLLGMPEGIYRRKTREKLLLCVAVALATVLLNILLAVFRTDDNHSLHLLGNICTDLALGWFLLAYGRLVLTPRYRLYRLASSPSGGTWAGTVVSVSREKEQHEGLAAYRVQVGERILFLPAEGKISLEAGEEVTLQTVGHWITEAVR